MGPGGRGTRSPSGFRRRGSLTFCGGARTAASLRRSSAPERSRARSFHFFIACFAFFTSVVAARSLTTRNPWAFRSNAEALRRPGRGHARPGRLLVERAAPSAAGALAPRRTARPHPGAGGPFLRTGTPFARARAPRGRRRSASARTRGPFAPTRGGTASRRTHARFRRTLLPLPRGPSVDGPTLASPLAPPILPDSGRARPGALCAAQSALQDAAT